MSRSVAQPSPASAPGATTQISTDAVLKCVSRLLRPLVRFAIKAGLKYEDLNALLRDCLFEAAMQETPADQRSNASKLSVMTGLHRKDISERLARPEEVTVPQDTKHSAARRVFERWTHLVRRKHLSAELPLASTKKSEKSFSAFARSFVSDVHPRAVLEELKRLGLVTENGNRVALVPVDFVAKAPQVNTLQVGADNVHAHLSTMIDNVLTTRPNELERAVWVKNIHRADAEKISGLAVSLWESTKDTLYEAMRVAPEVDATSDAPRYRIRVGAYLHCEEQVDTVRVPPLTPGKKS
jgi:hypothetical protein